MSSIHQRYRPKTSALNDNSLLIEDFRRLDHFAFGAEQHRVGELVLHELEAHDPVIDLGEERSGEVNHVNFDATLSQTVGQGPDKAIWILGQIEGAIEQIDANNTERLLLKDILLVQHSNVQDDIAGRPFGLGLESNSHPAVTFVGSFKTPSGHRVGEYEKRGSIALATASRR